MAPLAKPILSFAPTKYFLYLILSFLFFVLLLTFDFHVYIYIYLPLKTIINPFNHILYRVYHNKIRGTIKFEFAKLIIRYLFYKWNSKSKFCKYSWSIEAFLISSILPSSASNPISFIAFLLAKLPFSIPSLRAFCLYCSKRTFIS